MTLYIPARRASVDVRSPACDSRRAARPAAGHRQAWEWALRYVTMTNRRTRSRRGASLSLLTALLLSMGALIAKGFPGQAAPLHAPSLSAGDLISGINQYRGNNGLYAYSRNSQLMSIAKDQSNYMASTGSITHSGSGGSRPIDRAYGAGYGGGKTIWVSEIIYGGFQASEGDAIAWWKTSQIHHDTMLSSRYVDIGAGVAKSGQDYYYTVVVGIVSGSSADTGGSAPPPALTESEIIAPVELADPQPDGSIVHTVQAGQSPWLIAYAYKVPLGDLLARNGLTIDSLLYEGQKLVVKPASETTPTSTLTPTPGATSTPRPGPTAGAQPTHLPTAAPTLTPEPGADASGAGPSLLSLGMQGLGAAILAVGVVGFLREWRRDWDAEQD